MSPLQSLLRRTAALALARAGTKKTTTPLLAAVERGGLAADAAAMALKAHPPASLESFFETKKKLPPAQIAFLGELGDLRAIEKLRPLLAGDDSDVKMAAVIALAKLGDESAAAAVKPWLKRGDPRLLKAAAEALVYLGAAEAGPAVAALLASDVTREAGLSLALRAPMRSLVEPLGTAMDKLSADDKPRAIVAIGPGRRAGRGEAARRRDREGTLGSDRREDEGLEEGRREGLEEGRREAFEEGREGLEEGRRGGREVRRLEDPAAGARARCTRSRRCRATRRGARSRSCSPIRAPRRRT